MPVPTRVFSRFNIPADILYNIFEYCMTLDPGVSNGHVTPPIILSHVCSSWRSLTWSLPALWKSIIVYGVLAADITQFDRTLHSVRHSLLRSSPCPLDITIIIRSDDRFGDEGLESFDEGPYFENVNMSRERMHILSDLLAQNSNRIQRLSIFCEELLVVVDLLSLIPPYTPMRQLEKITIRNTGVGRAFERVDLDPLVVQRELSMLLRPQTESRDHGVQNLYPRVRTVSLEGLPLDWARFCPVKLKTLTLEDLANMSYVALWAILHANRETLTSLFLGHLVPAAQQPREDELASYCIPNLDRLSLGLMNPSDVVAFFSKAELPSLTRLALLEVQLDRAPTWNGMTPIETMAKNGLLHRLQELELGDIQFEFPPNGQLDAVSLVPTPSHHPITPNAFRFFTSLQSLQQLVLNNPDDITLNTLNYLSPRRDHQETLCSTPVPALTSLRLLCRSESQLNRFLEMRRLGGELYKQRFGLRLIIPEHWESHHFENIPTLTSLEIESYPDKDISTFSDSESEPEDDGIEESICG